MKMSNIGLRFSPLSERVLFARFGKDPDVALETRDAMNEFLQVLVQFVGVGNAVDFGGGDEQFTVTLTRKKEVEDGRGSSAAADLSTVPDAMPAPRNASTGGNEDV